MKCNPTVKDIYDFIDSFAPFDKQCEWDNSGLIVGSKNNTVKKIGVVLDITNEAVAVAKEKGCDLIISHHPVIFRATKNFLSDNAAYQLASSGISAICAHTSLDIAKGGVNDALAAALGFNNAFPFSEDGEESMIRIAEIPTADGNELAKTVADKLKTGIRIADSGKSVSKVALCGGSGGDFIEAVAKSGCDAYITGDILHHEFLDALELGLTLIAAGHFETENPVVTSLAEKIRSEFAVDVEIIPQNSPVKYIY